MFEDEAEGVEEDREHELVAGGRAPGHAGGRLGGAAGWLLVQLVVAVGAVRPELGRPRLRSGAQVKPDDTAQVRILLKESISQ